MDVLSEVLRAVRLTGALYFEVHAAHPWVAVNPSMRQIGPAVMPDAEHVIPFHILLSGEAWAMPADRSLPPTSMKAGDVLMFPLGAGHIMTSDRNVWNGAAPDPEFYSDAAKNKAPFVMVDIGGSGEESQFICGYLGCDASPFNPLLEALPQMLVVPVHVHTDSLMRELLRAALDEKDQRGAGAETVLAKVSELMFVQAIRQHMDRLPESTASWLCGLRDEHIGKALQLIHSSPEADWTLERLGKEAGLSRSVFAERFARYTGQPPMHYLGRWRMQVASRLLEAGESMGRVAERVGYSSEAAFQRAFKKLVGVPPGTWRRGARADVAPTAS